MPFAAQETQPSPPLDLLRRGFKLRIMGSILITGLSLGGTLSCHAQFNPLGTHTSGGLPTPPAITSLAIDQASVARKVLESIPAGSALERFEVINSQGQLISYVALTETSTGGLVFVNQKLVASVNHEVAQAFYSCRGYATATGASWVNHADAWLDSLIALSTPTKEVSLNFSGQSTTQSIKNLVDNPVIGQLNSLINIGTNPLNVFKRLSEAHSNSLERQRAHEELSKLLTFSPGDAERKLADAVKPQEVSYMSEDLVMSYPSYSIDFFIHAHTIRAMQQPSFYQLARVRPAVFYTPDADWSMCTPTQWAKALAQAPVYGAVK